MRQMLESDIETLLFYSFRYALGRRTYAVADVSELLIDYESVLHENTKKKIREEIEEAIERGEAGMAIDIAEWQRVLEAL